MSGWTVVHQYRTPIDPDYGGATSTITVWLDNLGGLVLGMDARDGAKVVAIPLSWRDAQALGAALQANHRCFESMTGNVDDDCVRRHGHDGTHRTADGRGFTR